jgi:hypothetical protein
MTLAIDAIKLFCYNYATIGITLVKIKRYNDDSDADVFL